MYLTAFLFAGQGSQYIGMGKELYEAFPESKALFDKADHILGFGLTKICFEGPEAELKKTDISQPAIVVVSMAAFEAFKAKQHVRPNFMAGLSLGEYSALIAAGVFSFEDGLRLVRKRGQIMEEAARRKPGKMAAIINLPLDTISDICERTGAELANLNAPGQVVITGEARRVDDAAEFCKAAGAKRVIPLEVSGGFHSSLMKDAALQLRQAIQGTTRRIPSVPVISNYTAQPEYDIDQIEANLVAQLYSPVMWAPSMRWLISKGVTDCWEFGPGKVLKGLLQRIDPTVNVVSIEKESDVVSGGARAI